MSTNDVETRIATVFARVFANQPRFDPQLARVNETRWTSLKHVEFLIALESEFDVRFDGADATDMTSIPAVVERVAGRLA